MDQAEFNQVVADAKGMAEQFVEFAATHGWSPVGKGIGANKKYAHVKVQREIQTAENGFSTETLQAFYAIDAETDTDQITHTDFLGYALVLDIDAGDVRTVVTSVPPGPAPRVVLEDPVGTIVTGLISVHEEAVPPTDAAHTGLADARNAAHRELEAARNAAHQALDEMNTELDAAHRDEHGIEHNDMRTDEDNAAHRDASRDVPPTGQAVVESFDIVPKADPAEVAAEQLQHVAQAEKFGNDVYSQQELYGAVRHQQVAPFKNWSPIASDLTSDELLTKLGVNRKANNRLDITWVNSLSNTLDRAVVDASAEKWPPHITPKDFDPKAYGEDLRILHFLEVNGGFRSVAVARIRKIG